MLLRLFIGVVGIIFLAGCASSQNQSLISQLQMRVGELEQGIEQRDQEINSLKTEIKDLSYEVEKVKSSSRTPVFSSSENFSSANQTFSSDQEIVRVPVSPDKIQIALKKAGYYEGAIDGKVGTRTKAAISQFQKDHGLKADGIIGKKTWTELQAYLE